jgi:hypothetical protein
MLAQETNLGVVYIAPIALACYIETATKVNHT